MIVNNNQFRKQEFEKRRVFKKATSICNAYSCPIFQNCLLEIKQLQQENARLKEENQALLTLVNWFEECGMGFDNIAQDDIINWEKFEEETKDMGYIESMIYYAKKYNEKQNLKEN